jgi:hypothetical protein
MRTQKHRWYNFRHLGQRDALMAEQQEHEVEQLHSGARIPFNDLIHHLAPRHTACA